MRNLKIILTLLFSSSIAVLFYSCEYPLKDENFVEVSNQPISSIIVNLEATGDTIILATNLSLRYSLTFPKTVKYQVNAFVNDQKVFTSQNLSDMIPLTPESYPDGIYEFKLQVISGSGTGSVAEALGYEALVFELKKVVIVEKSAAQKVKVLEVKVIDGLARVRWEKYPKVNFASYTLVRNGMTLGTLSERFLINDRNQTTFTDSTYIGGEAKYFLLTRVVGKEYFYAEGDQYSFKVDRPTIVSFSSVDDKVIVKWTKPKLYGAFQSYVLRETYTNPKLFESTNLNDTTFTINNFGFSIERELELTVLPKKASSFYYTGGGGAVQNVYLGERFPAYSELFVNLPNQVAYYYYYGTFNVVTLGNTTPSHTITRTLNYMRDNNRNAVAISANGKYLYVGSGNKLLRLDPLTLEVISETPLSTIVGVNDTYPFHIVVSNQNRLAIDVKVPNSLYEGGYASKFIAIINGEGLTVTDTLMRPNTNVTTLAANENLTHLYECRTNNKDRIVAINSSGVETFRASTTAGGTRGAYLTSDYLYAYNNSKLTKVSLSTYTTEKSTAFSLIDGVSVDPVTNTLTATNWYNYFVVYDLNTGEQLKKLYLWSYAYAYIDSKTTMYNNRLYTPRGLTMVFPDTGN